MELAKYIDPQCILFLEAGKRDEALLELVHSLYSAGKVFDEKAFYKAIIDREKIVSTGIGMGVAIPHAKLKEFDNFFIAIGVQKGEGLEWNSIDKAPVRLIFMIGGPDNRQTEYLQVLSRLTFVIKDKILRQKILRQSSVEEVVKLFSQY